MNVFLILLLIVVLFVIPWRSLWVLTLFSLKDLKFLFKRDNDHAE